MRDTLIDAWYDEHRHALDLEFGGGASMRIPVEVIPELNQAPASSLEAMSISPSGDALSWLELAVDIQVPDLVERAFGARLFAAATGRRGGRCKSQAKAAASKANGAKGGRPRSRAAEWVSVASSD